MAPVKEFHTSGDEDHNESVYHYRSGCGVGRAIICNGHYVAGRRAGDTLCESCTEIALEGSDLFEVAPYFQGSSRGIASSIFV
jgi:hypothetical protein